MQRIFCLLFLCVCTHALQTTAQPKESVYFRNLAQVTAAAYSADNSLLSTASRDSLYIWKIEDKTMLGFFKGHEKAKINDLVFTRDSNLLISAGSDKLIKIWKTDRLSLYKTLTGHIGSVSALALSPDGKLLASVSEDVSLRIWDLQKYEIKRVFYGHKGKLSAVAFSQDGRYIATAGEDCMLIVQEVKTGNILRKTPLNHLKWIRTIAFAPDGKSIIAGGDYYLLTQLSSVTSSETNLKDISVTNSGLGVTKIAFMANGKLLAVSTSENNLKLVDMKDYKIVQTLGFRTNRLAGFAFNESETELLALSSNRIADKTRDLSPILGTSSPAGNNLQKNIASSQPLTRQQYKGGNDLAPPQILIISPQTLAGNKATISTETVVIKGQIMDDNGVFKTLINGQEISLSPEGMFEIELKMVFGENQVTLEALDAAGNTSLKKILINRSAANGNDIDFNPATAKNFLLVIGIDTYKYWKPLSNAVNDSQDLKYVLTTKYTFEPENTILLNNEEATRKIIYEKFKELIGKIRGNDNLMIYFSGHGHYDASLKEGYWIPVDAQLNNDADYIPNSYLLSLLRRMEARHIFVVADACFSGALFAESSRGYIENVEQLKSRWALTSGRLEYVSDGSAGQHSPFAKVLIDYLKDTRKQRFPVSELVQHVKVETANTSSQTPIGNPLKSIGDEGGEFIFYKKSK